MFHEVSDFCNVCPKLGDAFLIILGTNGAISLFGTIASFGGGVAVGAAYWLMLILTMSDRLGGMEHGRILPQWSLIFLCAICSAAGSAFDSLLGATVQYSGKMLFFYHLVAAIFIFRKTKTILTF